MASFAKFLLRSSCSLQRVSCTNILRRDLSTRLFLPVFTVAQPTRAQPLADSVRMAPVQAFYNQFSTPGVRLFCAAASQVDQTLSVLRLYDKIDASKITLEARFVEDLGLDSLDVVELVMAVEDEFSIEISDEEAEKLLTVQQVVDLVAEKTK